MLTNFIVMTLSQYIYGYLVYVAHLILMQYYVNYFSVKLEKIITKKEKEKDVQHHQELGKLKAKGGFLQLNSHMKKNEIGPLPHTMHKN